MKLIDAKCPNCGSTIKINADEKTAVCEHCNSKFLVDENVTITNNYIVKNDFSNEALFNEIDKYIAQFSLNKFDELYTIAENLKSKFPHKGIARICILHSQFIKLILKYGSEEDFKNEVEKTALACKKYKPKSYKNPPPFSKYLDNDFIDLSYSEDIDEILTETEYEKYEILIESTKEYIDIYNQILSYNKQMLDKFSPYQAKFDKYSEKVEKQISSKTKKQSILFPVSIILAIFIILMFIFSRVS